MYEILGELANIAVKVIVLIGIIKIIKNKIDDSKIAEEKMTDKQKEIRQKEMDRYSEQTEKWTCPSCGALNQKYLTTCLCGQTKV